MSQFRKSNSYSKYFCALLLYGLVHPDALLAQQDASGSPAQLAAAIAHTMSMTKPMSSGQSPIEQRFEAHGNVVESTTTFRDKAAYVNAAARHEDIEASTTRYMCNAQRRAYIKEGVAFHEIYKGPADTGSFQYVIDERACSALTANVKADSAQLTKAAGDIAGQLTAVLANKQLYAGSRFQKAEARDATVIVTSVITAPAFADFFKLKTPEIRGRIQGLFCSKFAEPIRQGIRFRFIFDNGEAMPVVDFGADGSVC